MDLHSPRLLGDIGGTHVRLAWQQAAGAPIERAVTYRCADHPGLLSAVRRYLDEQRLPVPAACAVGIATPVTGDLVAMTNLDWSFSIEALRAELGVTRLVVLNDFTAMALALPDLGSHELLQVGGGPAVAGAPVGVLGPGTGLGVSGLLPAPGGGHVPIQGEGGHVTLAPVDDVESRVIEQLRGRFGHVSAERVLSGSGLVNLYDACASLAGRAARPLEPADVLARADSDPDCAAAVEHFCGFLGSVAGNLALTLGARGGIYVGGGIVPRMIDRMLRSSFRERFEAKGRFRSYLAGIPVWVIQTAEPPALRGAARALG